MSHASFFLQRPSTILSRPASEGVLALATLLLLGACSSGSSTEGSAPQNPMAGGQPDVEGSTPTGGSGNDSEAGGDSSAPADECITSNECRESLYPQQFESLGTALDCEPYAGYQTCICDETPCRDLIQPQKPEPGETGVLGRFDIGKDLLLCHYDGKPDEDDLHSVAGWATMLADPRFANVNYHCTAGAYGEQGGTFLDEPKLFDLAFGSNWSSAHVDWDGAVQDAADEAATALEGGGDIWVAEAGQSDFTADVIREIKSRIAGIDTQARVHVVQHSDWNEDQTSDGDLSYTQDNTDYHKVADGNQPGNGTPGLVTDESDQWSRVKSDSTVEAVWNEAEAAARRGLNQDWDNEHIEKGGMDFSDTVEVMYVFGFEGLGGGVEGFFDEFLGDGEAPNPDPEACDGAGYADDDGVVIIDPESTSLTSSWSQQSDGYGSGNIVWQGEDSFNTPGNGVLTFTVKIVEPGTYGLKLRSKAGGSSTTEENDTWLKIEGTDACGVYGMGDDGKKKWANGCGSCGAIVEGSSKDCWYKVYVNDTNWTWRARTSDRDARTIHADFDEVGVYTLRLSARSKGHHVDRIVMWHVGSREETDAQGASLGETVCQ